MSLGEKINEKMAGYWETRVEIQKVIESIDEMKIIDQFINFCSYYHENEEKCRHCDFILSPRFVYAKI